MPTPELLTQCPRKTPAGEDEVRSRARGLSRIRRQLLIAANGRYTRGQLRDIAGSIGGSDADLSALLDDGLLTVADEVASRPTTAQALAAGRRSLALAKLHLLETCPMIFGGDLGPRELLASVETPAQLHATLEVLTELAARRKATAIFDGVRQVALHLLPRETGDALAA
ncbi:MAG: hypothetical protein KDG55_01560 [Rhodocyclaceae bacterium]|nr:hypothetical protein [Rhodocyclaceae bacterium]